MTPSRLILNLLALVFIAPHLYARATPEAKLKKILASKKAKHQKNRDHKETKQPTQPCGTSCQKACHTIIPITCLPYTIRESGKYCLARNLTFDQAGAAAIIIEANNVTLNFNNHTLTIAAAATGVLVIGNEVSIENDAILCVPTSSDPASIGIHIFETEKITLDGMFIVGFNNGVLIEDSQDIMIKNSRMNLSNENGISVNESHAITVYNSSFTENGQGLLFDQESSDCLVSKVIETNAFLGSFIRWVHGITIEDSIFEINNIVNPFNCLQFGSTEELDAQAYDVIIRNCQFINRNQITAQDPSAGFDGVLFAAGSNGLMENCIIDINAQARPAINANPPYVNGALHISSTLPNGQSFPDVQPTRFFSNLRVRNCAFSNLGGHAVTTENSTFNLTIENCLIGTSLRGINLVGSTACVIKNNEIQKNKASGVVLGSSNLILPEVGSSSNNVEYNVIANNVGTGIDLTSTSTNNMVKYNELYTNGVAGIINSGINNQIFYNIAYNNGLGVADNYIGVSPAVIGAAGSPMLLGQNISA